jgi:hypothetical protein
VAGRKGWGTRLIIHPLRKEREKGKGEAPGTLKNSSAKGEGCSPGMSFHLLAFGFWLLAFGFWLLAFGFWLSSVIFIQVIRCIPEAFLKNGVSSGSHSHSNQSAAPAESRAIRQKPAGIQAPGELGRLAYAVNGSPRVQGQLKLGKDLQSSRQPALAQGQASPSSGEIASGNPMVVQMLKSAGDFTARLNGSTDARLLAVVQKLGEYHAILPQDDVNSQQRLRLLSELDRLIFTAHAAYQQQPLGSELKTLYEESETEHRTLITEVAQHADQLPIDTTGMGAEVRGEVLRLWRAFVNGTGNLRIKVEEGAAFRQRMYAGVAKLLQHPYGRQLITELSAPDEGAALRVILGSDFSADLQGATRAQSGGSEAIPLSDLAEETEKNYEFKPVHDALDPGQYREYTGAANNPAAFNAWLEHTLDRQYFKWGDTFYRVGARTGSYVRITGEGTGTLVGENDTEALAPEFITIGHELGHSRRQLSGKSLASFVTPADFGITNSAEADLWHNSEELVNIQGEENSLRGEHGVARRAYHAGDVADVRKKKNFRAYEDAMFAVYNQIKGWTQTALKRTALWNELFTEMTAPEKDWSDNGVAREMMAKASQLRPYLAPLHQMQVGRNSPDLLYESANEATRRKLDLDADFTRKKNTFNRLLQSESPAAFVSQAPELCNQMGDIARRLTVEAATESSEPQGFGVPGFFPF